MTEGSGSTALRHHVVEDGNILSVSIEDIENADLPLTAVADEEEESSMDDCDRIADNDLDKVDFNMPLKNMVLSLNRLVCQSLDTMESQIDSLTHMCVDLEAKADTLLCAFRDHAVQNDVDSEKMGQTVIVGVPQPKTCIDKSVCANIGPNVTLITLNTEEDFPNGSWLGDENNSEMRVRTHLSPSDMLHINTTCLTVEKMALTLLDYLFDRETQACSNISGTGKHHKKQLDPLLIYGIRCHLMKHFQLTDKGWHRIKQNLDSKCRTAFRRKTKGLSLTARDIHSGDDQEDDAKKTLTLAPTTISEDLAAMVQEAQVVHTPNGQIQVLHATPEQIARIQQIHRIQILAGDDDDDNISANN